MENMIIPDDYFCISEPLWTSLISGSNADQQCFLLVRKLHFSDVQIVNPEGRILGYDSVEDCFFDTGRYDRAISSHFAQTERVGLSIPVLGWAALLYLLIRFSAGIFLSMHASNQLRPLIELPFLAPLGALL